MCHVMVSVKLPGCCIVCKSLTGPPPGRHWNLLKDILQQAMGEHSDVPATHVTFVVDPASGMAGRNNWRRTYGRHIPGISLANGALDNRPIGKYLIGI